MRVRAGLSTVVGILVALAAIQAQAAAPAGDIALADEVMGAVQTQLAAEEARFSAQGDPRAFFASVYGEVMTGGIRRAIAADPGKFNAPLELAMASMAFLPLYTDINQRIAATLPGLRPGQRISDADVRRLRAAGVPRHWAEYLRYVQDPRRQNETGETVAGIIAHIVGDLKEVVRADLHHVAGQPGQLEALINRSLPGTGNAVLRGKLLARTGRGSDYPNPAAFSHDYEALNSMIADRTQDAFKDIAESADRDGSPDFLAEAGYRAMRGIGPFKLAPVARGFSWMLFSSWRGGAYGSGERLHAADVAGDAQGVARATEGSEGAAVVRIRALAGLSRATEHPLVRPPLRMAASVLAAVRRAGDPVARRERSRAETMRIGRQIRDARAREAAVRSAPRSAPR